MKQFVTTMTFSMGTAMNDPIVVSVHPPKIDLSNWPRDDSYNRLRVNTFQSFEEVHRYVVEIGGLAIAMMDELAKKYGFEFKAVARDSTMTPGMTGPFWVGPPVEPIHFVERSGDMSAPRDDDAW